MIQLSDSALNNLLAPYGLNKDSVRYLGGGQDSSDGVCYGFERGGRPMVVKILAWKEPETACSTATTTTGSSAPSRT